MRGYMTDDGFRGWIPSVGKYWLFASETDYIDYFKANE